MQKNPVGASQKLEFQKKRNSNFLNARNPSAWSFSFQKKRSSNFLNARNPSAWSFSKLEFQKKGTLTFWMQKNPVLGASQKLEFQKKRNSNFLNARNPSAWSFSKLEFQKKRNSNLPPQNLQCFTGNFFLLNPKIAKIHENSPATWIVYRHFFSHFLGFSVQGKKYP